MRIDLTENELRAVLDVVDKQVSERRLKDGDALFDAERALDSALLAAEDEDDRYGCCFRDKALGHMPTCQYRSV